LSYGQRWLLAFEAYLAQDALVVVADELVNGLHHQSIQTGLQHIGERQAFLTSQNPLLLDDLTLESPEQVARSFVRCAVVEHEGKEKWEWRNLTEQEAQSVFEAHEVGIQQVSETLETRGLW
jgi:hypothetical protein